MQLTGSSRSRQMTVKLLLYASCMFFFFFFLFIFIFCVRFTICVCSVENRRKRTSSSTVHASIIQYVNEHEEHDTSFNTYSRPLSSVILRTNSKKKKKSINLLQRLRATTGKQHTSGGRSVEWRKHRSFRLSGCGCSDYFVFIMCCWF